MIRDVSRTPSAGVNDHGDEMMDNDQKIIVEQLDVLVRGSDDDEGYQVMARGDGFKIGLVARIDQAHKISYSVEFMIRVLEHGHKIDPPHIEKILRITEELIERGYTLTSQDDGWIYAECNITLDNIDNEKVSLMALLDRYRKPR
jgi:hypothetical protein